MWPHNKDPTEAEKKAVLSSAEIPPHKAAAAMMMVCKHSKRYPIICERTLHYGILILSLYSSTKLLETDEKTLKEKSRVS